MPKYTDDEVDDLIAAGRAVIDAWAGGNLAEAMNELEEIIEGMNGKNAGPFVEMTIQPAEPSRHGVIRN